MLVPEPEVCAPFDPNPHAGRFEVPAGACDCHAHVFTPASDLVPQRLYTPAAASLTAYQKMLSVMQVDRAVIVQPSVYGSDNRATLAAVATNRAAYRAVVVLDDQVSLSHLRQLHDHGARGARINALFSNTADQDDLIRLAGVLAEQGWHMQMLVDVSAFDALEDFVRRLPVPVVFDHMGHVPAAKGINDPGFQALLRLMSEGRVWTKLSGAYRMTDLAQPPYTDVSPFARALVAANPERCLWASDWPHPHIPVAMPNDGALLDMLMDWAPNRATRERILVTNPANLYGFES